MNTFKFLSLFVAIYGLQAQAQTAVGGGANVGSPYGNIYQYYQGQSQGQAPSAQNYGQSSGMYGQAPSQNYGQSSGMYGQAPSQNYGQSSGMYGQAPSQNYGQGDEGQYGGYGQYDQNYGNYGQTPSNPYDNAFQYYQRQQGQQSPGSDSYGAADPYGFDAQDPTTPSRRGSYGQSNDQYGQYGTPDSPASPYPQGQGLDPRTQRPSRDGYGYQDPQDSQDSMSNDDGQQIRQHPHRGQIGSRKSQSDMDSMDSFAKDQKSCDAKLNDTQKKALVDIVEKSVGGDEGKISDALKSKKITLLGSSVKQQGSAVDCKFQSQVTILFKSNNSLTCTVKATASIDSTGKAAFGKEQNFVCGDESKETNVRTGVEVYKTNYQGPAVAPSRGGRA